MKEDTMYHNILIPEFAKMVDQDESNWFIFSTF